MNAEEYSSKLHALERKIGGIKNAQAHMDLKLMATGAHKLISELSREEVEVRRKKKLTPKYTDLQQRIEDSLNNLEQFILFAALKSD